MNKVETIKQWCVANYGGDWILETMSDNDIDSEFSSLADAINYCELMNEQSDNCRFE